MVRVECKSYRKADLRRALGAVAALHFGVYLIGLSQHDLQQDLECSGALTLRLHTCSQPPRACVCWPRVLSLSSTIRA